MTARELDLIIVATITPDTCCPSAANWPQAKLNAPRAVTFDVTAACFGFIFGLNVAEQSVIFSILLLSIFDVIVSIHRECQSAIAP